MFNDLIVFTKQVTKKGGEQVFNFKEVASVNNFTVEDLKDDQSMLLYNNLFAY